MNGEFHNAAREMRDVLEYAFKGIFSDECNVMAYCDNDGFGGEVIILAETGNDFGFRLVIDCDTLENLAEDIDAAGRAMETKILEKQFAEIVARFNRE